MFSNLEKLTIPEGEVVKITAGGVTLWERTGSLPSAYQRVEWVRAENGIGAYIKLGFTFDTAARFKIGFYAESTAQAYLFGAAENSGALRCMITFSESGVLYGSKGDGFIGAEIGLVSGFNEWECTLKKGLVRASNLTNGSTGSATSQSSYTMTNELYLLGQNYNGTPRFGSARKVAFFDYYDKNDELICSLTPCYRKSDGVIGMYDTVRRLFLTNAGSGSFTKGADVTGYTNQIPISTDSSGNIYDGDGWKENTRLSSSGVDTGGTDYGTTGFIPFGIGSSSTALGEQYICIANAEMTMENSTRICLYKADKSFQAVITTDKLGDGVLVSGVNIPYKVDENGYITYIDLTQFTWNRKNVANVGETKYIRVCGKGIDGDSIITINEPIAH